MNAVQPHLAWIAPNNGERGKSAIVTVMADSFSAAKSAADNMRPGWHCFAVQLPLSGG